MNSQLSDHLDLWGFEQDCAIFSDGSLGFALEATPLDVSCFDDEKTNALAQRVGQFLNSLPSGVSMQFVQDILGGNERTIQVHQDLGAQSKNPAVQALSEKRLERLRNLDSAGVIPHHALSIFVRKPLEEALLSKPRLWSGPPKFQKISEARFERHFTETTRLKDSIVQGLALIGLTVKQYTSDEIADLIYRQWNPDRAIGRGPFDPEEVRSSLLFTDAAIEPKGFSLGGVHFRVISLKVLPDQTFSGMAARLRDLPFDSRLLLTVSVPDQAKELQALQTSRRLAYSMARGKQTGVSDIESEAKFQDLETLIEQLVAQGEKVFRVSLNVLLKSTSIETLESQVAQTLMVLRDMGGAEGMEESLASFPIFLESSLPNAKAKERIKRVKTSNLADLIPLYGPWRGFEHPRILLRTRSGSLFRFDPFSSELANSNQLVSGGSGSGKSFMTNILLLQMLKENPKVYFVDIGGSYKKLCDHLNGQYLPLGVSSGISINPFDLGPGEKIPSSHKLKFLLGLIELMTKEEDETRLPKLHRAEIEDAIAKCYEKNPEPRLSHLRELLLAHEDVEIRQYGRILSTWCGDTPYGQFVDRPTTISLSSSIVAFDLKGMESYPDLQAVCLFLITDFVWREVQKDRQIMKFLVFDECWKLLKSDSGLVFIEEVFRTFRKYYASAIAISQDIDDFAKSKIAGAILPNCAIKWVLMQQQSDPVRIKEALDLNDNELGLVRSLTQEKGSYSEAFLIAQKQRTVAVIESGPLEYWIATTHPKDLAVLEKTSQECPELSALAILEKLAERYPRGAAA